MTLEGGRLSLAFRELTDVPSKIIEKFGSTVKDLDLSNNKFVDVSSVRGFRKLETLVLDNNHLNSNTRFPLMPSLKTLWVNRNRVTNLSIFMDRLTQAFPNLTYLSMLNNEACPNFFNGGSLKQYNDYRLYVISRIRKLVQLDSSPVTAEERARAIELYGNIGSASAFDEQERERELAAREKKEEERRIRDQEERQRRREERKKRTEQQQQGTNTNQPATATGSTDPKAAAAAPVDRAAQGVANPQIASDPPQAPAAGTSAPEAAPAPTRKKRRRPRDANGAVITTTSKPVAAPQTSQGPPPPPSFAGPLDLALPDLPVPDDPLSRVKAHGGFNYGLSVSKTPSGPPPPPVNLNLEDDDDDDWSDESDEEDLFLNALPPVAILPSPLPVPSFLTEDDDWDE